MFLIDDVVHWSASDLTTAAECEYALLRTLDYKLGWADPIEAKEDPLQTHIAGLGDRHEERLLDQFKADGRIAVLPHPTPAPPGSFGPDAAPYGAASSASVDPDPDDPRVIMLCESRKPGDAFSDLPVALVPGLSPNTDKLEAAIKGGGVHAAAAHSLPASTVLNILARRSPRLIGTDSLPGGLSPIESVVAALVGMNDSYVAIQGPPGTGKTFTGSRVIKELVEKYGWRIGVVAQSHAVVERTRRHREGWARSIAGQ